MNDEFSDYAGYYEWTRSYQRLKGKTEQHYLWVKQSLFDDNGNLISFTKSDWDESWVKIERREINEKPPFDDFDDDIPF